MSVHACVSLPCVCSAHRGEKTASDPLELDVGPGNQTQGLSRAASALSAETSLELHGSRHLEKKLSTSCCQYELNLGYKTNTEVYPK